MVAPGILTPLNFHWKVAELLAVRVVGLPQVMEAVDGLIAILEPLLMVNVVGADSPEQPPALVTITV